MKYGVISLILAMLIAVMSFLSGCKSVKRKDTVITSPQEQYCSFIEKNKKAIKNAQNAIDTMHNCRLYSSHEPVIMQTYTAGFAIEDVDILKWKFEHYETDSNKINNINEFMIDYANNIIKAYKLYDKCLGQTRYNKKTRSVVQYYTNQQMQQINIYMDDAKKAMHNWEQEMINASAKGVQNGS